VRGIPPFSRRRSRLALSLSEREEISRGLAEGQPSDRDIACVISRYLICPYVSGVARTQLKIPILPRERRPAGCGRCAFRQAGAPHRSRIYTLNQYFSAARIDEFKLNFTVELQEAVFSWGFTGGFSGSIVTDTGGTLTTNLYTNP